MEMESLVKRLFRVKISTKGQVVIPKPLRETFHFNEGETIILIPTEEGVMMKRLSQGGTGLRGLLKGLNVDIAECETILEKAKKSLIKVG